MNTLIQFKKPSQIFIAAALACVALSPRARAVLPAPTPDGAYPGFNTAEGLGALFNLTTGNINTAIGAHALYGNKAGSSNTAVGGWSLAENLWGYQNVATGQGALRYNTGGAANTATGFQALYSNRTGGSNTAMGYQALYSNRFAGGNTAIGGQALFSNVRTTGNTAIGYQALYYNKQNYNTAIGFQALVSNSNGLEADALGNTAIGYNALLSNRQGGRNTAIGSWALRNNTTGIGNIALGSSSGDNVTTASDVICIGANRGAANVSNTTWVGNIYGVTPQSGTTAQVVVSDTGQLGTLASSERFKKDIAIMGQASEGILALRPVTFHYKTDGENTPQFGLIAEEVAKVNPALVLLDKEGKPYTVRYDAVNAMLLNEFLKEHLKNEQQEATITRLEKQVEALTVGLEKVSAQLELSKPAPQRVKNTD